MFLRTLFVPSTYQPAATVESFLRCGDLASGFTRLQCTDCGHDRLLALTCKGRHFCPVTLPPPPPFNIETMEPIEPPWQAIKEWIADDETDLDWFNCPRNPSEPDPDWFDQSQAWKPEEIHLDDPSRWPEAAVSRSHHQEAITPPLGRMKRSPSCAPPSPRALCETPNRFFTRRDFYNYASPLDITDVPIPLITPHILCHRPLAPQTSHTLSYPAINAQWERVLVAGTLQPRHHAPMLPNRGGIP